VYVVDDLSGQVDNLNTKVSGFLSGIRAG